MKLYYSGASPFARKALATAIECGLRQKITLVPTNPHESRDELVALNPFSKIPVLVLDDASVLYESYFICEYFDDLADAGIVLPRQGGERRKVLHKHLMGNGVMDAAVLRRVECLRGKDPDREKNLFRQTAITGRALDRLEAEVRGLGQGLDLGNLSIAIALDYLDFRFDTDQWRIGRPKLADWHAQYSERASLVETKLHDAS